MNTARAVGAAIPLIYLTAALYLTAHAAVRRIRRNR